MFVSETHLPQVLAPANYLDDAVLEREIDRGFLPAWHLVAVSGELPVEGSFVTRSLLGREVILWRRSGRIRAFLNVCPHRFCAVTSRPSGCFTERLRCQHHGWEFDEEGLTRRIPDAPAFRPMEQLRLGLDEFPVATVADLVFVSLAAEPRPLEEFLGPAHALCAERCGGEWEHVWSWEPECPGNWKLANEITLEGYHAAETHASTLGRFPLPREEAMSHELPSADRCGLRVTYAQEDHPDIRASMRQGRQPSGSRRAELLQESRAPPTLLRPPGLRTRATLPAPWPRRRPRTHPIRAPPTQARLVDHDGPEAQDLRPGRAWCCRPLGIRVRRSCSISANRSSRHRSRRREARRPVGDRHRSP
jgi:phenylpropionate dioxygenase-like ring-hydroxylating dioxygenase large terminal subunit